MPKLIVDDSFSPPLTLHIHLENIMYSTTANEQKKLSVLLPVKIHKDLKLKALGEDKSITEIITSLIDQYLESWWTDNEAVTRTHHTEWRISCRKMAAF